MSLNLDSGLLQTPPKEKQRSRNSSPVLSKDKLEAALDNDMLRSNGDASPADFHLKVEQVAQNEKLNRDSSE